MDRKCKLIYITNPPVKIRDRNTCMNVFRTWGNVSKIYIEPEGRELKVYYDADESTLNAAKGIKLIYPDILLTIQEGFYKVKSHNNCVKQEEQANYETNMPEIPDSDRVFDIRGEEIPTFTDNNGNVYISVNDLKKRKFGIFNKKYVPKVITDEAYMNELRNYLRIKAKKYMVLFPPENEGIKSSSSVNSILNEELKIISSGKNFPKLESNNGGASDIGRETPKSSLSNGNVESLIADVAKIPVVKPPLQVPLKVCVTEMVDQKSCYVQLLARDELDNILKETAAQSRRAAAVEPKPGLICAATFEGEWYRCVVERSNPLKVFFIDFGNVHAPTSQLKRLTKDLCDKPAEAILVRFDSTGDLTNVERDEIISIVVKEENADNSYQVEKLPKITRTINCFPSGSSKTSTKIVSDSSPNDDTKKTVSTPKKVEAAPAQNDEKEPARAESVESVKTNSSIISALRKRLNKKEVPAKKAEAATVNPRRTMILDVTSKPSAGIIAYIATIDSQCLCLVIPNSEGDTLNSLEEMEIEKSSENFVGKVGDFVAVEDEGAWRRATVLKKENGQYKVALDDYGKIIDVTKVVELPEKYAAMPEFTYVCDGSAKFIEAIQRDEQLDMKFDGADKVTVTYDDSTTEEVACRRWNPCLVETPAPGALKEAEPARKQPEEEPVVTSRPRCRAIQNNDVVMIVNCTNGKLYVKTREQHQLYTKIQKNINEYQFRPVKRLIVNQLALCSDFTSKNSSELHRVSVVSVDGANANVEYLDLGKFDIVPLMDLKTISETLAAEDICTTPVKLKGFENVKYPRAAVDVINGIINKKDKYTVKNISDDVFTFTHLTDGHDLSKKLGYDRVLFDDLPINKSISMGRHELMCVHTDKLKVDKVASFILSDQLSKYYEQIELGTVDGTSYNPKLNEVCVANFEDMWFRAKVVNANEAIEEYSVKFIDYGNEATVTSAEIRKLPESMKDIPPLAIVCELDDGDQSVENGAQYVVDILNVKDETCVIKIIDELNS